MTPMQVPCSRSAHDENVLARRPQWDLHGCHSQREKRASLEGALMRMCSPGTRARLGALGVGRVRLSRAVKGNLATPSVSGNMRKSRRPSHGLAGGRVRQSRTVQGQ